MVSLSSAIGAPAGKASLVEGAYDALKAAIRNNLFAPGYQGSEQEIASQLGMSRTPVHEAIIRLQEEGLVRVLPRRGVLICAISPDDMREIYEVIIALEGASAELIAEMPPERRAPAADALDAVNARMEAALAEEDLVARRLAWTVLRPGRLTDDAGTGRVRLAPHVERGDVPRDDVAAVLVALLDSPGTARQVLELVGGDVPVEEAVAALS